MNKNFSTGYYKDYKGRYLNISHVYQDYSYNLNKIVTMAKGYALNNPKVIIIWEVVNWEKELKTVGDLEKILFIKEKN